jgi:hypothetical protein
MASSSASLSLNHSVEGNHSLEGGWFARPRNSLKVCRLLEPAERSVLEFIECSTITKPGQTRFRRHTIREIASEVGYTVEHVARAAHRLARLALIIRRTEGHGLEYRAAPENYQKAIDDRSNTRPPRTCNRKPPTVEISAHPPQLREGQTQGEGKEKANNEQNQSVDSTKHDLQVSFSETGGSGEADETSPGKTDQMTPAEKLERFCVKNCTPKLGTVPPQKIITRCVELLKAGCAPVEALEVRIMQRIGVLTSWGFLLDLARDVAQAFHARRKLLKNMPEQYDLRPHWASATQIRAWHADSGTPEAVKIQIVMMWPELQIDPKTGSKADMYEQRLHEAAARGIKKRLERENRTQRRTDA